VINISARHREREVGALAAGRATRRPFRTELGSADQPERPLGDVLPLPKRQPVTPLGRSAADALERVQAGGVDELKSGERLASVVIGGPDAPEATAVGSQTDEGKRCSRQTKRGLAADATVCLCALLREVQCHSSRRLGVYDGHQGPG
jgi:hypothetical protein